MKTKPKEQMKEASLNSEKWEYWSKENPQRPYNTGCFLSFTKTKIQKTKPQQSKSIFKVLFWLWYSRPMERGSIQVWLFNKKNMKQKITNKRDLAIEILYFFVKRRNKSILGFVFFTSKQLFPTFQRLYV